MEGRRPLDWPTAPVRDQIASPLNRPVEATDTLAPYDQDIDSPEADMWDGLVELLRATIFTVAHLCGGSLGGGIFLVSAGVRLAMLPLTLRLARRARVQQAKVAALKPQLDALQERFAKNPRQLVAETHALYAANGIKLFDASSLAGLLVQAPVLSGLFAAVRKGLGAKVRFLWVPDLARPEGLLLLGVTALSAAVASTSPTAPGQTSAPTPVIVASVVATLVFLWAASSAVALSVGAGSFVSLLQNWLLARDARREQASA
jgi:membrane protein insertase Oxa1/YidC/SpoIIIJ